MDIVENDKQSFMSISPSGLHEYVPRLGEIDGNVCRQRVEAEFTVQKMAERYEALLEGVMSGDPSYNW